MSSPFSHNLTHPIAHPIVYGKREFAISLRECDRNSLFYDVMAVL